MLEQTITVDAGVTVQELRERLHGWKVDVPALTSQENHATIGAVVATRSCSPTSYEAGSIREWIEEMTVIVDSGEEHKIRDGITPSGRLLGIYQALFPLLGEEAPMIRAQKPTHHDDATGYQIWNTSIGPRQLLDEIVGSEGTLGIITTVTLRLIPHKEHALSIYIPLTDTSLLQTYVDIGKHHQVSHMFLYDSTFMELAERYHYNVAPYFDNASYVLTMTYYGYDKKVIHDTAHHFMKTLPSLPKETQVVEEKYHLEKITDSNFLHSLFDAYTQGTYIPSSIGNGLTVSLHDYASLLKDLTEYVETLGKLFTITGNIGSGHISLITLFDPQSPTHKEELARYGKTICTYAKKYKGGISAIGGDGIDRSPYLPYMYNQHTVEIFKKIKEVWDPEHIFGPGKKIALDPRYIDTHLRGPKQQ
jgi:FAD/FMN-containing dehydrogenase